MMSSENEPNAGATPKTSAKKNWLGRTGRIVVFVVCALGVMLMAVLSLFFLPWHDPYHMPTRWSRDWWTSPVEFNAPTRLPLLQGLDITAIHLSSDGGSIWLGTGEGQVYLSRDGGATWTKASIEIDNVYPDILEGPSAEAAEPKQGAQLRGTPSEKLREVGGAGMLIAAADGPVRNAKPLVPALPTPPPLTTVPTVQQLPPSQGQSQLQPQPLHENTDEEPPPPGGYLEERVNRKLTEVVSISMEPSASRGLMVARMVREVSGILEGKSELQTDTSWEFAVLETTDGGLNWHLAAETKSSTGSGAFVFAIQDGGAWLLIEEYGIYWQRFSGASLERTILPDEMTEELDEFSASFDLEQGYGWVVNGSKLLRVMLRDGEPVADEVPITFSDPKYVFHGPDPESVVVIADGDTAHVTRDSGKTWSLLKELGEPGKGAPVVLSPGFRFGLALHDDASGKEKTFFTKDGGASWTSSEDVWDLDLFSFAEKADMMLWVDNDELFSLRDDFKIRPLTRSTAEAGIYVRVMSPLFWAGCGLFLMAAWAAAWRMPPPPPKGGLNPEAPLSDSFISDKPVQTTDEPDALGLRPIVEGLGNYLRNPRTGLPLTVAITGSWGSGKSSMMNLLEAELREARLRPVHFNAWHHQNEEHVLAALLEGIRQEAVPPWWHFDGILFRWRLARLRLQSHWLTVGLYMAACAAGVTLITNNWKVFKDSKSLMDTLERLFSSLGGVGGATGVAAVLGTLWKAWHSFSAFGVSPAHLLEQTAGRARIGALKSQTSARHQFCQEFRDVTRAFQDDMRLVIFVDDLDRCKPEMVMTVLENLNFLTTAGDCVIVLGMDSGAIKDAITEQMRWRIAYDNNLDDAKKVTRDMGQPFSGLWLQKMVQVSVSVPRLKKGMVEKLMPKKKAGPATLKERVAAALFYHLRLNLKVALMLLFSVVGIYLVWNLQMSNIPPAAPQGYHFTAEVDHPDADKQPMRLSGTLHPLSGIKDTVKEPQGKPAATAIPSQPSKSAPSVEPHNKQASIPSRFSLPLVERTLGEVKIENSSGGGPWMLGAACGLFYLLVVIGWKPLRQRLTPPVADDSAMLPAINQWLPELETLLETPRAVKGFLNKVRFYDMMSQAFKLPQKVAAAEFVALAAYDYDESGTKLVETELPQPCQDGLKAVKDALKADEKDPKRMLFELLRQSWEKRIPAVAKV